MFFVLKRLLCVLALCAIVDGNCSDDKKMQKITFELRKGVFQEYITVSNADDVRRFVGDCIEARKVSVEDMENIKAPMDAVMQTLLVNVFNQLSSTKVNTFDKINVELLTKEKKSTIAVVAWIGYQEFTSVSPDTSGICLSLLNKIAPSNFDKAEMLLYSQSLDDNRYTPKRYADWRVIGDSIHLLRNEKNGRGDNAAQLLGLLKNSGNYKALLGE